jgi:hypothetical protein
MQYAIVGYFDERCSLKVREVWKGFAENNIDDYMHKSVNGPHCKLAIYTGLDMDSASHILNEITSENCSISIVIKNYSLYISNNHYILSFNMASSIELLEFQQKVKIKFDKIGKPLPVDYFDRGRWQPDCPLTTSSYPMKNENLPEAAEYLSSIALPINGYFDKIGIIEFHPAKKIFTVPLKSI